MCNVDRSDWDEKVPAVLWAYRTANNKLSGQTPFKLIYGQEAVVPLHFRADVDKVARVLEFDSAQARED